MVLNKIKEDIRRIFKHEEPEEFDPWNYEKPQPVSQEEIDESMEILNNPPPPMVWRLNLLIALAGLWVFGHVTLFYVGAGAPWAMGLFFLLFVNIGFMVHYMYLLLVERGKRRHPR